jgi:hypothetical protein
LGSHAVHNVPLTDKVQALANPVTFPFPCHINRGKPNLSFSYDPLHSVSPSFLSDDKANEPCHDCD